MVRAEIGLPRPLPTCLTFYRTSAVSRCRTRPASHHKLRSHWHLREPVSIRMVLGYPTVKELSRRQEDELRFLRTYKILEMTGLDLAGDGADARLISGPRRRLARSGLIFAVAIAGDLQRLVSNRARRQ